jgi:DNA modification methylase
LIWIGFLINPLAKAFGVDLGVPRKPKSKKQRPFYNSPPPKPGRDASPRRPRTAGPAVPANDIPHAHLIPPAHFELREDGSIGTPSTASALECGDMSPPSKAQTCLRTPQLVFQSDTPFIRLYHGNSLELLDAIAAKYPAGRFDAIFADPPYFLSNGGITCHAGKMVKVDKGDWDVSRGPELNHEFNVEWLRRCQRVLKPNGTIWVTGTHHVIFSIGYAMQQLGYKILNDIAWEKPNPPPNLSCRYFTHSTETVLWAAKNEKSKHVFNYQEMRKVTGKQMKTVWRKEEFFTGENRENRDLPEGEKEELSVSSVTSCLNPEEKASVTSVTSCSKVFPENEISSCLNPVWTMTAPGSDEKVHGKHPTQKPVALVERCLLASTNEGDLVLDPFLGNGTTAVASLRLKRGCVGVELDLHHVEIAARRADREIIEIWLRHFRIRINVSVVASGLWPDSICPQPSTLNSQPFENDLDHISDLINGSRDMADVPEIQTERIFHECKFVFLACRIGQPRRSETETGSVVHTTVDVSLQEAWAKTPNGKKQETTHVVRCETEIFRIKNS